MERIQTHVSPFPKYVGALLNKEVNWKVLPEQRLATLSCLEIAKLCTGLVGPLASWKIQSLSKKLNYYR